MAESDLILTLRAFKRRSLTIGVAAAVAWGILIAALLVLSSMWLDLMLELSPSLRIICQSAACAIGVMLTGALLVRTTRSSGLTHLARRIDRSATTGGQIISGVDLMMAKLAPQGLTSGLAQMAVHQAGTVAQAVPPQRVIPTKPIFRASCSVALMGIVVLSIALMAPRLAATQWLRFSDPFGDHPPYSPILFHVEPGDASVAYGSGLDIKCTTEGGLVDRAELVLLDPDLNEREALPMFREPDGQWRATMANMTTPGKFFIRTRSARSHRHAISIINVPRIDEVWFRVTPPAYTRRPAYEGPLPQGGLSGLPATRVDVRIISNRPLSKGMIVVTADGDSHPTEMLPDPDNEHAVTGSFEITAAGKAKLAITDVEGLDSPETFETPITLLADHRPFVRMTEPREISFATPTAGIPVSMAGEDDYGLSQFELYRNLNESRPLPAKLNLPALPPVRADDQVILPLDQFKLQPGDTIKLFSRVEDNDPAGAKGSESSIVTIRIISQEDLDRMIRTRQGIETLMAKYEQARRTMETLQDGIAELEKELAEAGDKPMSEAQKRKLDDLTAQLERAAMELQRAMDKKLPFDVDANLSPEMAKVIKSIQEAAKQSEALAGKPGMSCKGASNKLAEMRKSLEEKREEYQKEVVEPLEFMESVYRLMEDQGRFVALYQAQRALAERMKSLDGLDDKDDPKLKSRMRDLQKEQESIREQLRDLLADIEQHTATLPDEPNPDIDNLRKTAEAFVKAVRASEADPAMSRAEKGLADFSGTIGYEGALSAADILEKFISQCQGMGGEGKKCLMKFGPSMGQCLSDSVNQLLANAGMGSKPGMGMGNGGGYSAQRSSLNNVGLYGQTPQHGEPSDGGSRDGREAARSGHLRHDDTEARPHADVTGAHTLDSAGASDTSVPVHYRRRVGAYFQSVAEETGQGPEAGR